MKDEGGRMNMFNPMKAPLSSFILPPSSLYFWSGRRDLNSRPSPWQGDALPLSYSRFGAFGILANRVVLSSEPKSHPQITQITQIKTYTANLIDRFSRFLCSSSLNTPVSCVRFNLCNPRNLWILFTLPQASPRFA